MKGSSVSGRAKHRGVDTNVGEWPGHVGILNDYVRIPYANGSSFASQFLHREFSRRGHRVTIVGPSDPVARQDELPERAVFLPSVPMRNHPGVRIPFPSRTALETIRRASFDVTIAQTSSGLMNVGVWCRQTQGVPFVAVNTLHLPSAYTVLLPNVLDEREEVRSLFKERIVPWTERQVALSYNQGDGLVVLSNGLVQYWRDRGVTVPIHVVPRSVDPMIFDRGSDVDPFSVKAPKGHRLLVVCRHTREKEIARLLEIFAKRVAPHSSQATLTLVGDGPDHDEFRRLALRLGVAHRTFFPGEFPVTEMANWYRHADLFVYTSLSETYGQVVSEALWCGLPVVAFADGMGVSQQLVDGESGLLIPAGPAKAVCDWRFGAEVLALLRHPERRAHFARRARDLAVERSAPQRSVKAYYDVFGVARDHFRRTRTMRPRCGAGTLAQWAVLNSWLAALGCIRPPTTVNRHGRRQPGWGYAVRREPPLPPVSTPSVTSLGA